MDGGQQGFTHTPPPALRSGAGVHPGSFCSQLPASPGEVQDAAPSAPSILPTLALARSGERARRQVVPKTIAWCSCAGARRAPCPPGRCQPRGAALVTALAPSALAAGSTGAFWGAATQKGGGWGCGGAMLVGRGGRGGALPCPWRPVGGITAARAAARPGGRPGAGEVERGSCLFGCPQGTGNTPARPPACQIPRRRAAAALRFLAPSPPS